MINMEIANDDLLYCISEAEPMDVNLDLFCVLELSCIYYIYWVQYSNEQSNILDNETGHV